MSTPDGVLREVAEALVGRIRAKVSWPRGWQLEIIEPAVSLDSDPEGLMSTTEDVLQALPEHLWERISITRVAPGRFVVVEAQEVPEVKPFSCRLRAVPPKGWIGLLLLLFALPGAAQTLAGTVYGGDGRPDVPESGADMGCRPDQSRKTT